MLDADGDWQFLSGDDFDMSSAAIVSLQQIVDIDNSVSSVLDMPVGYTASKVSSNSKWTVRKN